MESKLGRIDDCDWAHIIYEYRGDDHGGTQGQHRLAPDSRKKFAQFQSRPETERIVHEDFRGGDSGEDWLCSG
eukprot:CAMPEP_0170464650 /NCGR_PEP_ID=MMETSP0123-20130129/9294_1 /TAXON_ID=182087 /ORGANISM="Favella ehrenbergii, Strain Fehren 1" /LENGTH=72 /DNA_ID=CAMNT_0010730359 /DNA_START=340 /DNA_END=558 /DNA_ORIENTATION=+